MSKKLKNNPTILSQNKNINPIKKNYFDKEKIDKLSQERILQKNVVYVIGLSHKLANKEILQKPEYFGQYGSITKILTNHTKLSTDQPFYKNCYSAYVYFSSPIEASLAILSVDNFNIDNLYLKTSFGRTKYCSYFLRNLECTNKDCFYLHKLSEKENIITSGNDSKILFHEQHVQEIKISNLFEENFKKKILCEETKKNIYSIFPKISEMYKKPFILEYQNEKNKIINKNNLNLNQYKETSNNLENIRVNNNFEDENKKNKIDIFCNENDKILINPKNNLKYLLLNSEEKKTNLKYPTKKNLGDLLKKKNITEKKKVTKILLDENKKFKNENHEIRENLNLNENINSLSKNILENFENLNVSKFSSFDQENFNENKFFLSRKNEQKNKIFSDLEYDKNNKENFPSESHLFKSPNNEITGITSLHDLFNSSNSENYDNFTITKIEDNNIVKSINFSYIDMESNNGTLILKNEEKLENKNQILKKIKQNIKSKTEILDEIKAKFLFNDNNTNKNIINLSFPINNNINKSHIFNNATNNIENISNTKNLECSNFTNEKNNSKLINLNNATGNNLNEINNSDRKSSVISSTSCSISLNNSCFQETEINIKTDDNKIKRKSIYSEIKHNKDNISDDIPDFIFDVLNKKISRFTFFKRFEKKYENPDYIFLENLIDKDDSWGEFIKMNLNS